MNRLEQGGAVSPDVIRVQVARGRGRVRSKIGEFAFCQTRFQILELSQPFPRHDFRAGWTPNLRAALHGHIHGRRVRQGDVITPEGFTQFLP